MINTIKRHLLIFLSIITVAAPGLVISGSVAYAASCSSIANEVASGAGAAGGQPINCNGSSGLQGTGLANVANKIVDIFSIIVGAVAIIMLIYGGFRYITSGGESGRVGNAKNTIIYAIIGLIIVALAQLIVHFVLNTTSSSVTQTS